MSETPPAEMADGRFDFYDDKRELYFWRDERTDSAGVIYSRPYDAEEVAGKAKRAQLDGLRPRRRFPTSTSGST
ncbi:hypothetical protein [Streptomyces sp. bgisy091]|uniref:hypothetical protein n=1 Tax=Streptomyces sp. bgisy091 TaxID=3413778 RepID=UPI003D7371C5